VISRTSVMRYKGIRSRSLAEIGCELGVDAIVEGPSCASATACGSS